MSVPSKVENFKIESSDSCLIFSWTHLINATGYYIYINNNSIDNSANLIATVSGSDIIPSLIKQVYIIGGQLNGYNAYYQIVGYNEFGIGTFSDNLLCKSYDGKNDINYDKLDKLTPRNLRNAVAWYDSANKSSTELTFSNEILTINNNINSLYQITATNSSAASTKYKNMSSTSNIYDKNITYSTDYYNGTYFYCPKGTYLTCNNLILEKSTAPESRVVVGIVYTCRNISGGTGNNNEVALWGTYNGEGSDRFQMIMSQNSRIAEGNMPVGSSINSSSPTIYLAIRTCSGMSQIRVNGQTIHSFIESSINETSNTLQFNSLGDNSTGADTLFHEMVVLKGPEWTMRDIYMLEGYFMNKWGLNSNLISHPYKFIEPYLESTISPISSDNINITFTPHNLNGVLVWYDANTSIYTPSEINNKISSIYNMELTGSPQLINTSLSVTGSYINFTNSQFGTINNGLNLPRPNKYVVGILFTPLNNNGILWGTLDTNSDRFQSLGSWNGTSIFGNQYSGSNGNPSGNMSIDGLDNLSNKPSIYIAVLTAGANSQIRLNGSPCKIIATNLNIFTESSNFESSNSFRINSSGNDSIDNKGNMRLHELVILGGDTWDMNDVYKLEGYFAHRWILDTNLPIDHPYKKNKPVIPNNIVSDFPSAPNIRTIVQFQGAYKIYYTPPINPGGIINNYKLYITDGTSTQTSISINQNPYIYVTTSTNRIKFRISAINSIGEGILSEEKSIPYTSNLLTSQPSTLSSTIQSYITNWYDTADSNTLIYSGATISGISNKKSGTSNILSIRTQSSAVPTYSGTGSSANIEFTSNIYAYIPGYSLPRPTRYVVAIVFTPKETNKPLWGNDNGGWDRLQGYGSWNGNAIFGNDSGSVTVNLLSSITTNTKYLYVAMLTATTGSEIRVNKVSSPINGGSTTFTESSNNQSTSVFAFNAIKPNFEGGNILLHELIILEGNSWVRNDAIEVETYLANKWGI